MIAHHPSTPVLVAELVVVTVVAALLVGVVFRERRRRLRSRPGSGARMRDDV